MKHLPALFAALIFYGGFTIAGATPIASSPSNLELTNSVRLSEIDLGEELKPAKSWSESDTKAYEATTKNITDLKKLVKGHGLRDPL